MSRDYCDHLIDQLALWGTVSARRLFGGFGLYHAGTIFGLVFDETLYFKVNDTNRADYEAQGCKPFTYQSQQKSVALPYWEVPADVIDDMDRFATWAAKAYQVGLASKKSKRKNS